MLLDASFLYAFMSVLYLSPYALMPGHLEKLKIQYLLLTMLAAIKMEIMTSTTESPNEGCIGQLRQHQLCRSSYLTLCQGMSSLSLSLHQEKEKDERQKDVHGDMELDSDIDNPNNSKIETTKVEAEVIARGLQIGDLGL